MKIERTTALCSREIPPPVRAGMASRTRRGGAALGQKAVVFPWPGASLPPLQESHMFFALSFCGGKVGERKRG
ncbi:MAG: hypothetical protein Q7W38_02035 [Deltaproteobacteria bacterium]|nr:hypothetical protein [Deltaproteobacteria bacterium]